MASMVGDRGWNRITDCSQPGNKSTGAALEVPNTAPRDTALNQVSSVRLRNRSATTRMTVAYTVTHSTGMRTKTKAAKMPASNRRPSAKPVTVMNSVAQRVRHASADRVPTSTLARWIGINQKRLSSPLSRSSGMESAAASEPDIPPASAHMGTTTSRSSLPVRRRMDSLTIML